MVTTAAIAGVIGAVAAVVAAIYAVRTFRRQVSDARTAERRHLTSVQPRPRISSAAQDGPTALEVSFTNPGGAATMWQVFIWNSTRVYQLKTVVPAHYQMPPGGTFTLKASEEAKSDNGRRSTLVCSLARDTEGRWWDCQKEALLDGAFEDALREQLTPYYKNPPVIEPASS